MSWTRAMNICALGLLFPMILAIHNAEEYFRHAQFARIFHSRLASRFLARPVIRMAMILLTIAATTLSVLAWIYRTPVLVDAVVVASFALMLNAFGHVMVSMRCRALTPGTISAAALVLPYSAAVIATLRMNEGMSWAWMGRMALLGFPVIPVAVGVFMLLGYAVSLLMRSPPVR
jgi:hypothetical protein